jgi:hypothetical protein
MTMLIFILCTVALIGTVFAAGLVVAIIGIWRGDRGKRLTGRPSGPAEAFTRRLLTGSRGYDGHGDMGGTR